MATTKHIGAGSPTVPIQFNHFAHNIRPPGWHDSKTIDYNDSADAIGLLVPPDTDGEIVEDLIVVVKTSPAGDAISLKFGTSSDDDYFATVSISAGTAVGTAYSVSGGTISWASTADTESERTFTSGNAVMVTPVPGAATDGAFWVGFKSRYTDMAEDGYMPDSN